MSSGFLFFFGGFCLVAIFVAAGVSWLPKKVSGGTTATVIFLGGIFLIVLTSILTGGFPNGGGSNLTFIGQNANGQIMLLSAEADVCLVDPESVRPWGTMKVEPGYYSRWFHWYYVEEPEPLQILGGRQNDDGKILLALTEPGITVTKRPLVITVEEGNQFPGAGGANYVLALPDKFLWVPAPAEPGSGLSIRERINKGTAILIIETGD